MTLANELTTMACEPSGTDLDGAAAERQRLVDVLVTYPGRGGMDLARAALDALDDEGLRDFGLDGDYLNLLRLFGREWPLSRVRETARAASRERAWANACYRNDLVRITEALRAVPDAADQPALLCRFARLQGWQEDPLPALLAEGGVVIACLSVSGFKHVPIDLALRGHTITQPVITKGLREAQQFFAFAPQLFAERLHVVDIQAKPAATLTVVRTLKRGGLVHVNIDGVTRAYGNKGERMWSVVPFAGVRVRVLNGIVRLAAAAGATIVPLVVPRTSIVRHRLAFGAPIRCPAGLAGEELEAFVQHAMETIYGVLGQHVLAHPEEWARLCKLHEIRVPDSEPDPAVAERAGRPEVARADVDRAFAAGRAFRLDTRRMARTEHAGREAWIDVYTLRAFVVPDTMGRLVHPLSSEEGVPAGTLAAQGAGPQEDAARAFLAELWRRGAVVET